MKIKNIPEEYETNILLDIKNYLDKTEMSETEQLFLNGTIRELKPKKILEVGVSAGGTSIIMLNAIKDDKDAKLYSIDYNEKYYQDPTKDTGYLVEKFVPELTKNWKLYTGGVSAKFIEKIGDDIDLCLLDTRHFMPGEVLDILMILPFMKKDGIIVLHDTNFNYYRDDGIACNVLFSTIVGEKIQPKEYYPNVPLANIGAFQINEDTFKYIEDIFFALSLNWNYLPTPEDLEYSKKLFYKYYDEKDIKKIDKIYQINKIALEQKSLERKNATEEKEKMENENKKLKRSLKKLKKEKNLYENSSSWKITKPLRKFKGIFRKE